MCKCAEGQRGVQERSAGSEQGRGAAESRGKGSKQWAAQPSGRAGVKALIQDRGRSAPSRVLVLVGALNAAQRHAQRLCIWQAQRGGRGRQVSSERWLQGVGRKCTDGGQPPAMGAWRPPHQGAHMCMPHIVAQRSTAQHSAPWYTSVHSSLASGWAAALASSIAPSISAFTSCRAG